MADSSEKEFMETLNNYDEQCLCPSFEASSTTSSGSILDGIDEKESSSPVRMAVALKKRVAKVGFDWNDATGVLAKLDEEVQEVKDAIKEGNLPHVMEELGDVFFVLSILSDKLDIDPEAAIDVANKKFERRFRSVEAKMRKAGISLASENITKMEEFWQETKKEEASNKG